MTPTLPERITQCEKYIMGGIVYETWVQREFHVTRSNARAAIVSLYDQGKLVKDGQVYRKPDPHWVHSMRLSNAPVRQCFAERCWV